MDDGNNYGKLTAIIDPDDIVCPVTFEKYTTVNFPVTLPCGHAVCIRAFEEIKLTVSCCPTCRQIFSGSFFPKKTVFLAGIAAQVQKKPRICCQNHPQESAVAICMEEKDFFCLSCIIEDQHAREKKITFRELNKHLQEKKLILRAEFEKLQDVIVDENAVSTVTAAILKNIEPNIHKLVTSELQYGKTECQQFENLLKKTDFAINKNLIVESIDLLSEVDEYSKNIVKNQNMSLREGENVQFITRKILESLETCFHGSRKTSEMIVALRNDIENLVQVPKKEKIKRLVVDVLKGFQPIDKLCSNLPDFTFLSCLELQFDSCAKINDLDMRSIGECLKRMSFLKTLSLNFSKCRLSSTGLKALSRQMQNLIGLQSLELYFSCCEDLTKADYQEFVMYLRVFNVLGSLKLSISHNKYVDDEILSLLGVSLRKLVQLNELQLDFRKTMVRNQGVVELIERIKDLKFLSKLNLNIADCGLIDEEGFAEFISSLGSFVALESLEINLAGCKAVNGTVIESFGVHMENVTALRTLSLDFYECLAITSNSIKSLNRFFASLDMLEKLKIRFGTQFVLSSSLKEDFLLDLSRSIGRLKNLKVLELNFGRLRSGAPMINSIGPCLRNLSLLESLQLQFRVCKFITDDDIIEVAESLGELYHLRILNLNFSGCSSISDRGIQALSQSLKNLKNLNGLSLEFQECALISDVAIIDLAKQVGTLKFINKLKLDFKLSNSLSDDGLRELCNCIKKFPEMVELSLSFGFSMAISDRSIKELGLTIKGLKDLQILSLVFESYHLITDIGLNYLDVGMKDLVKMENLTLRFNGCKSITDESVKKIIKDIEDSMKNLHKLEIYFESLGEPLQNHIHQLMSNYK